MRIGTKLLLAYLALMGLLALMMMISIPRMVESAVIKNEEQNLEKQAKRTADWISTRFRGKNANDPGSVRQGMAALGIMDELLADDALVLIDPNGVVVVAANKQLQGKRLPLAAIQAARERTRFAVLRRPTEIPGLGQALMALEPLTTDVPALQGFSILMVRDVTYIQNLSRPIAQRVLAVSLIGLVGALVVAGWLSREMVKRLRATGEAAHALAEGDLARRAPEQGNDEISDLSRHFNHMAERIEALVAGLRRSEQARKDLLVLVSHELRTPMTSITGFAEALRDGVVQGEERKQRYYQIISSESARLNRLINDVFDVAKLEAGQMDLRLQEMPLAPWLLEFAESFKPAAEGAGARLELAVSPEAERARVYGDHDRLDQVLTNLVSNALRFTPAGEAVTIRANVLSDDVVIEVIDRGPGLPPEEAARIFDRFYQGSNQGAGHKGAGLGLAIVKSLVEAHGGQVGIRSTPGSGANFWFSLKLLQPQAGAGR